MPTLAEIEGNSKVTHADALVVGGGPAGCAAAHVLTEAGLRVLVAERGGRNRDKPCGDMFMPSAVAVLRRLGLDDATLRAAGGTAFDGIDLLGQGRRLWTLNYAASPVWIIPRRRLDQALRDSLPPGARVLYRTGVTEISQMADGQLRVTASVEEAATRTFICRAVVLASGAADPLSLRWGIAGERLLAPSISAYSDEAVMKRPVFEFLNGFRPGYRWAFPTCRGQVNLGICSLRKVSGATLKEQGRALADAYRLADDLQWRGGVGALWSGRGERWHHAAGVVACGDAAGLVDPYNGEGLTAALMSAEAAGSAVAGFLLRGEVASLKQYSNWVSAFFSAQYGLSPLRTAWKQLCG